MIIVHWTSPPYAPILAFFVENPLVAIVVNEWHIASNQDMPSILSIKQSMRTIPTYIPHNNLAVCFTLGVILSATGPATSARNNCTPPIPSSGNIAILKTMIPIPPINGVKDRQNKIPCGKSSIINVSE